MRSGALHARIAILQYRKNIMGSSTKFWNWV